MTNHYNISEQIPSIHSVNYPCLSLITKQIPDSGQSKTSTVGIAFGHVPHSFCQLRSSQKWPPRPRNHDPSAGEDSHFSKTMCSTLQRTQHGFWACFILWSPRTKSYDCHIMVTQMILWSMDSMILDWNVLQNHFGGGAMEGWNAITKLPHGTAEGSQLQLIGSSGGPQPRRTQSQLVGIPKKSSPGIIILWKSEDVLKHVKISQLRNWWGWDQASHDISEKISKYAQWTETEHLNMTMSPMRVCHHPLTRTISEYPTISQKDRLFHHENFSFLTTKCSRMIWAWHGHGLFRQVDVLIKANKTIDLES